MYDTTFPTIIVPKQPPLSIDSFCITVVQKWPWWKCSCHLIGYRY